MLSNYKPMMSSDLNLALSTTIALDCFDSLISDLHPIYHLQEHMSLSNYKPAVSLSSAN